MNILSAITIINAYSFLLIGVYILHQNSKNILNRLAAAVNLCFMIWCLSDTFFYHAANSVIAMQWHKIGSIGWIFLTAFALHFFYILAGRSLTIGRHRFNYLLYLLPIIFFAQTWIVGASPIAKDMVESTSGLGWTYVPNTDSVWFWIFSCYILSYFGIGVVQTRFWAKNSKRLRVSMQANAIIAIDTAMILLGFGVDIILPSFSTAVPPLLNVVSIVWGIVFFYIAKNYKLLDVYAIVTPELIMGTVMDPIMLISPEGFIMMCNPATERMLGYSSQELIGRELCDLLKGHKYNKGVIRILSEKKVMRDVEIELIDREENVIHTNASLTLAENKLDGLIGIVINLHDVSEYKAVTKYWEELANYDKLTNLPNRRLFLARLQSAMDDYIKMKRKFALAFIDLDGFKKINDTYGHDFGDQLLVAFSETVKRSIRKQDIFARIGGDEFVLLYYDAESAKLLLDQIHVLRKELTNPLCINDIHIQISISVGISSCPHDAHSAEELFRIADQRMYLDKQTKTREMSTRTCAETSAT